jgi:hypothetical protein
VNLLAFIPAAWNLRAGVAVFLVAAATLGALYLQIRHDAFNEGYDKATLRWELELARVKAANLKVVEDAQFVYRADLDLLELTKDKINDTLIDQAAEAARDPGADTGGIGADSVRRLNAIR